ncbi:MAG TPA: hypothetical protein VF524_00225, partial [Polyangia bacterium]
MNRSWSTFCGSLPASFLHPTSQPNARRADGHGIVRTGIWTSGERIRIQAQLADTSSGAQLWSESFDGNQGDLFALQELVTVRIGRSIGREMLIIAARDSESRKSNPRAADLMLRAKATVLKPESKANYREQQSLYREVLRLEPNNAVALVGLAMSLSTQAYNQIEDPIERDRQFDEARDFALAAQALDANHPLIYVVLSDHAIAQGDYAAGTRLAEKALSLDPKNPLRYQNAATAYIDAGDPA